MQDVARRFAVLAIVGADASPGAVVRRAALLARQRHAPLHVCLPAREEAPGIAVDEEWLRAFAVDVFTGDAPVPVSWERLPATSPHEAIITLALDLDACCVVKDIGREPVLRRALLTPLDWELIRRLPADLLLAGTASPLSPTRVLAAVDVLAGSDTDALNDRIVDAAQALTGGGEAAPHLVSVAPRVPVMTGPVASAADYDALLRHLEAFRRFAERRRISGTRRHRVFGAPADAIAGLAERLDTEVTVIGSRVHADAQAMSLGATAQALLRTLKSDLLLIRPRDAAVLHHAAVGRA